MRKLMGVMLFMLGLAGFALARPPHAAPEIDPGSAVSALTVLIGVLLVRKRRGNGPGNRS